MSNQTSSQIDASGKTGAVCAVTGPYKCSKHADILIIFQKGDKFAACPYTESETRGAEGGHDATWIMVRDTDEPGVIEIWKATASAAQG